MPYPLGHWGATATTDHVVRSNAHRRAHRPQSALRQRRPDRGPRGPGPGPRGLQNKRAGGAAAGPREKLKLHGEAKLRTMPDGKGRGK